MSKRFRIDRGHLVFVDSPQIKKEYFTNEQLSREVEEEQNQE
jgi:hypothetical protein